MTRVCPTCRFENAPEATHCKDCRAPLSGEAELPVELAAPVATPTDPPCPTCRHPNDPAAFVCRDCGTVLREGGPPVAPAPAKPLPGATAHLHGTQAAFTLPPRLTATPPVWQSQGESRPSVCPSCEAPNPWDARLCGRCGALVPPASPGEDTRAGEVGVGVNLPGAPTWVERIPKDQQFVPEPLAAEREATRRAQDEAAAALATALPVPLRERNVAALTGGVLYAVVSFAILSWLGDTALLALPLSVVLGTVASWFTLKSPDPGAAEVAFGVASFVTAAASGVFSLTMVPLMALAMASGSFASYFVREERRLLVGPQDDPKTLVARERVKHLKRDLVLVRGVLAGALLLAFAWAPCAFALGRDWTTPFLVYALMLGAVATLVVLTRLERRRTIPVFVALGLLLALSGRTTAPAFAVLGVLLSAAAGYGLDRLLPVIVPVVTDPPSGSP